MNSTLDKRKINLVQSFLALDNKETISKVENLLNEEKIRIYEESISKKMTHSELSKLLEQSERDFENGDFHTIEEVKSIMKNW
jgi:arsenate reductase-like glutaredoxin family protein